MMLYLLTHGSCSCILMGLFAFQRRNHLLVCVNILCVYNIRQIGHRVCDQYPKLPQQQHRYVLAPY